MGDSIRDRRTQYETAGLDLVDVDADPAVQWHRWHDDAFAAGVSEPNAMSLATIGLDDVPAARIVLVRGVDAEGLTFFTNYASAKSRELEARSTAAATFGWLDLHRQVRVRGQVTRVDAAESDEYFASRPRGSQVGAWASPQSEVIAGRDELDRLVGATEERFADTDRIPRPPHWGGWRLRPTEWEFWQGRPSRLHDRLRYRRTDDETWVIERLAP